MKKIAIYGAGGLGREVAQLINQINAQSPQWEFLGYFDDNVAKGKNIDGRNILGSINDLNAIDQQLYILIGIADNAVRKKIVNDIANQNIIFPSLIHPSVIMDHQEVNIGEGSLITAGNILTTDISIGKHSIINLACTIGHDVVIGDYCAVMPGVHLSGNVKINKNVLIGTGARVLQNLIIDENSKIGAGSVVTKGVQSGETVVGVPARVVKNR